MCGGVSDGGPVYVALCDGTVVGALDAGDPCPVCDHFPREHADPKVFDNNPTYGVPCVTCWRFATVGDLAFDLTSELTMTSYSVPRLSATLVGIM